jgi:hypothetical protein
MRHCGCSSAAHRSLFVAGHKAAPAFGRVRQGSLVERATALPADRSPPAAQGETVGGLPALDRPNLKTRGGAINIPGSVASSIRRNHSPATFPATR